MKYKYFIKKEPIAYFKIKEEQIILLKKLAKFRFAKNMLIKTDKNQQIEIHLVDLKHEHQGANQLSLVCEDYSETDFMFYARQEQCKFNPSGREYVLMPIIVPPIASYNCFIHTFDNGLALIEMRTDNLFFTFILENPLANVEIASNLPITQVK